MTSFERNSAAAHPDAARLGPQAVVSLRDVRKTFGDFTAVESLSLDVQKGELLCLLGPSGCGKTTTLRMVAGFVEPTRGQVFIDGKDVTTQPPYRRDTGMVFQSYALFPHMSVGANVAFGLENLGVPKNDRERQVHEVLTLVELRHLIDRYPRELSGGQQQRVALARALALRPAVLLLDEPFSNLDAQLRIRLREELRRLIDRVKITTMFVTHDQEEALVLSDRIAVMNEGRVQQVGSPEDIYERPATRFVAEFIGRCSILEGRVEGGLFVSESGLRLPVQAPAGKATIVVRPEYIDVAESGGTGMVTTARVVSASYLGALTRVQVAVGADVLLMEKHFRPGTKLQAEDEIKIQIDPTGVRILPPVFQ